MNPITLRKEENHVKYIYIENLMYNAYHYPMYCTTGFYLTADVSTPQT